MRLKLFVTIYLCLALGLVISVTRNWTLERSLSWNVIIHVWANFCLEIGPFFKKNRLSVVEQIRAGKFGLKTSFGFLKRKLDLDNEKGIMVHWTTALYPAPLVF